ncbi:MAG: hypothetical protein ACSLEY_00995 [Candidatus Saccharimonadales bacterium]
MVERQPGRPSEDEFTRAALRLVAGEYAELFIYSQMGGIGKIVTSKKADIDIVKREHLADGLRGTPETLIAFATRQLAEYKKARNS